VMSDPSDVRKRVGGGEADRGDFLAVE
jgi:hypothetical protein